MTASDGDGPRFAVRYAARSVPGRVRSNNEDSVHAGPRLLAVADGMGGQVGGETASAIVIGVIRALDSIPPGTPAGDGLPTGALLDDSGPDVAPPDSPPPDASPTGAPPAESVPPDVPVPPTDELRSAIETANRRLREAITAQPALAGMGTTLTALLVAPDKLILGHVGDSRAYLLRADILTQITRDDTLVQNLIDQGEITEEQARVHPYRAVIMHALSGDAVDADISVRIPEVGDRYLLSSDGLNAAATVAEIQDGLRVAEAQAAADRLVQIAMDGGGPDNISVVVLDILPPDLTAALDSGASSTGPADPASDVIEAGAVTELADLLAVINVSPEAVERLDCGETDVDTVIGGSSRGSREGAAAPGASRAGHRPGRLRHPKRTAAISSIGVLVVVAALFGLWRWTQAQYFVAVDRQHKVTVYRGVHQTLVGYRLYHQVITSSMTLEDLQPAARNQVSGGIAAASRGAAEAILANLRANQQLPPCPTPAPTATAPSSAGSVRASVAAPTNASKAAAGPALVPTPSAPSNSATEPQVPGQDCR